MNRGDRLTLTIDKPAAGGRMIARHDGAIVLVSGAIPGEVIEAEVEKVQRGTVWARTRQVVSPSPDREAGASDAACGGNVFAHVRYDRQLELKRDIIRDAFTRIGRLPIEGEIALAASPVDGYRMRARLHVVDGRAGFFREGTHQLCDPASAGQLLPETIAVLRELEARLASIAGHDVVEIELAENCAADQRALHLVLGPRAQPSRLRSLALISGVAGVSCGVGHGARPRVIWGEPEVTDAVEGKPGAAAVRLTRQAAAFFQANRFLLAPLVHTVVERVGPGPVADLYAGVGLFSVPLAGRGDRTVVAVEGDWLSAQDLQRNAIRAGGATDVRHEPVEAFLGGALRGSVETLVVDPPRTGLSREAMRGVLALGAARVVYVSCDVATVARDARALVDDEYRVREVRAFDLFPNTAHVETLVVFEK